MSDARAKLAKQRLLDIAPALKNEIESLIVHVEPSPEYVSDGDSTGWYDHNFPGNAFVYSGALASRGFEAIGHEWEHDETGLLDEALVSGVSVKDHFNDSMACLRVYFDDEVAPAGTADYTFQTSGMVAARFSSNSRDALGTISVQPDGRIVVSGRRKHPGNETSFLIGRHETTGELHAGFGGGRISYGRFAYDGWNNCSNAIQSTGRIVAVCMGMMQGTLRAFVHAVHPNGALDTSFAGGGTYELLSGSTDWHRFVTSIRVQADDKILVSGFVSSVSISLSRVFVARFTAAGQPDATFGSDHGVPGIVVFDNGLENWQARDAVAGSDGRIFIGGFQNLSTTASVGGLVVRNSNWSPDYRFGTGGAARIQQLNAVNHGTAMEIGPDGRIFVVMTTYSTTEDAETVVAAFLPEGGRDYGFGTGGLAHLNFFQGKGQTLGNQVVIQDDGTLLIPASFTSAKLKTFGAFLLSPEGKPVRQFGEEGVFIAKGDLPVQPWSAKAARQKDGKFVLGATSFDGAAEEIALMRIHGDRRYLLSNP